MQPVRYRRRTAGGAMTDPLIISFAAVVLLAAAALTPFIADLVRCLEEVTRE